MALLRDLLLFCGALSGLAFPVWRLLGKSYQGPERFTVALAGALVIGFLAIFALYVAGIALAWFWLLPALGLAFTGLSRASLRDLRRDPATGWLVVHWLVLALWSVGWHGLVVSYSGGAWAGDWIEHYDRARFFLQDWPTHHRFLDYYSLPARPPLANLWTAGLLSLGSDFFHYQVFTTLLSCLVIFPLGVLLQRWNGNQRAGSLLLLVLMLNPLLVQNATFPWTKLPAAFFILLAVTQLWPTDVRPRLHRLIAGSLLLSAAMLTHYSAGPWILGLGAGLLFCHRQLISDKSWRQHLLAAAVAAGVLFLPWLAWSLAVYGPFTTFAGNTTLALAPDASLGRRLSTAALNLWSTLSPLPADQDVPLLQQSSPWGQLRDRWFLLYQLKLPYAAGLAGGALLIWHCQRLRRSPVTDFWLITAPLVVVLGTVAHSAPDHFGLVHIVLQPLVLLGLVWFVRHASMLPRWLRFCWGGALALDFALGILMHFAVQALWLDRWRNPDASSITHLSTYPWPARANWISKQNCELVFLSDRAPSAVWVGLLIASALIAVALLYPSGAAQRSPKAR